MLTPFSFFLSAARKEEVSGFAGACGTRAGYAYPNKKPHAMARKSTAGKRKEARI